jgi:hypothetical protein
LHCGRVRSEPGELSGRLGGRRRDSRHAGSEERLDRPRLVGNTDIKKGITSSTFKAVPDAPVSTFDLVLPEGPHSALTAYGSLCGSETVTMRRSVAVRVHGRLLHVLKNVKQVRPRSLNMPTALTGQNGAVIKQTTKIAVSGCPKAKKAKKTTKAHKQKH